MKKIVYIYDVPTNQGGGAQESMNLIINELNKEFEFYLITPNQKKIQENQLIIEKYASFYNLGSKLKKINLVYIIYKYISKVKPDIIHIQMPMGVRIINTLMRMGALKNIKLIYTDRHIYDKYDEIMQKEVLYLAKRVNKIITTTEYNKKLYENLGFSNIQVISNTCGSKFELYNDEIRIKERKKYHIKDEFIVGFCGRFCEDKNWELAKKIIEKIQKYKNIKILVCLATDRTLKNFEECNSFFNDLKMIVGEERLILLRDLKFDDMEKLYYIMDSFVITSKTESFGRTAIEAMSRKNIVFSTKIDGVQEVVGIEEVLYTDEEDFSIKFDNIFNNKDLVSMYKEIFYERFKSNFNLEKNITAHRNLYK